MFEKGDEASMRARTAEPNRTVVFVMGPPHGGTTLFDLVLGSHASGFSLGEFEKFGTADKMVDRAGRVCGVCEGVCPVWDEAVAHDFEARRFGPPWKRVLARVTGPDTGLYEEVFAAVGARYLVDSSKSADWIDRRLADRRDWRAARAKLLVVTRDGRAVVNSYRRKAPDVPIEEHVARWVQKTEELTAVQQAFPEEDRLGVAYETLATRPEETAALLARFAGVAPDPAMIRYWETDHHLIGGNLGTRALILRKRAESEKSEAGFGPGGARAEYYNDHSFAITLDERWREEMPSADLATFERLAGDRNAAYRFGE